MRICTVIAVRTLDPQISLKSRKSNDDQGRIVPPLSWVRSISILLRTYSENRSLGLRLIEICVVEIAGVACLGRFFNSKKI